MDALKTQLHCGLLVAAVALTSGCATRPPVATPANSMALTAAIAHARDRVYPSLVRIDARQDVFHEGERERSGGTGSGTIFSPEGHVLTNYHVAGRAKEIKCTLFNKEQVTATLVGSDPWTDLAVLKLNMDEVHKYLDELPWVPLGSPRPLEVGEFVLAMGTPYGLSRTVTFGIVSNVERYLGDEAVLPDGQVTGSFNNWIQTDAAINPGNSGGPLVNLEGDVVGVNSRASLGADGLGYAVPIAIAERVAEQILDHGEVIRSWVGLRFQNTQDLEGFLETERDKGAIIREVEGGSPAQDAGVERGDLLLAVDGAPVSARFQEELPQVRRRLAELAVGTTVELQVRRGQETATKTVVTKRLGESQGDDHEVARWGFTVRAITERMARELRLKNLAGVLVMGVKDNGVADRGGLAGRDVITEIDGRPVADLPGLKQLVEELRGNKQVLIKVRRFRSVNFVLLEVEPEPQEGS